MSLLDPASPQPLYLQLANFLRRQLAVGVWQLNDRLPPEIELCQQFDVSRGTVRQAMDLLVNQGLLQRIPGKGTFVTGINSQLRSQMIGIVVPYLRDSLIMDVLRGVESVLRRNGYSLIFCHSEGDLQLERTLIEQLQRKGTSGLILFPVATSGETALLSQIIDSQVPLVIIDRRLPYLEASHVLVDNAGGAYQAVAHLLALGHRRIACISLPEQPSSIAERIRGYEQALRAAGILPLAAISLALDKHPSQDSVPRYTAEELAPIDQLLSVQEPPTALFCVNDFIALGVMQHVLARGLKVPQDLAIAGFDDIALAPYMPVPLTTVAQPKHEIGVQAAQLLLDQIISGRKEQRQIILPTTLVVRQSTELAVLSPSSAVTIAPPSA
jgi:DNA-binding LacI/PurR family transcriptional regulator